MPRRSAPSRTPSTTSTSTRPRSADRSASAIRTRPTPWRSASGFPVRDRGLLGQALIHSSWLHEHPDAASGHNERLEFLGDAVVSLAVSEALYARHPDDDEGVLSARRAAIVSTPGSRAWRPGSTSGRSCCSARARPSVAGARGRRCWRPRSRRSSARSTSTSAGTPRATGSTRWPPTELAADLAITTLKSPKSRLQEHTQRTSGGRPDVPARRGRGPDHEKQFRIEVIVEGRTLGVGEGPSRRIAETRGRPLEARRERAAARSAARRRRRGGRGRWTMSSAADDAPERPGAPPGPARPGLQVVRGADAGRVRAGDQRGRRPQRLAARGTSRTRSAGRSASRAARSGSASPRT